MFKSVQRDKDNSKEQNPKDEFFVQKQADSQNIVPQAYISENTPIQRQYDLGRLFHSQWSEQRTDRVAPLQAKLTVGAANDKYEQEADRIAKNVVQRIHSPLAYPTTAESIQRNTFNKEEDLQTQPILQRKTAADGGLVSTELESTIKKAKGGGQSLEPTLQAKMGQVMGADFSGVKVHTDSQSDQLNQAVQAKAFTTGKDVFFRKGAYNPGSKGGQELIAHELTHVVQQNGADIQRKLPPKEEAELEKIMQEQEKEEKLRTKPDDTIQRSPDPRTATTDYLQRLGAPQGQQTITSEGGDITAVTRKGKLFGGGLSKTQEADLKKMVEQSRTFGNNAKAAITALNTEAQTADSWEEIDYNSRRDFENQFCGADSKENDITELRLYIAQAKEVIERSTAGVSQPIKIVESKPKHLKSEDDRTILGYVKYDVDSVTREPIFPFLDPTEHKKGNIHLNFAYYLTSRPNHREGARMIYHEATHRFAHTDDNVGYGNQLAIQGKGSIADTIKNADCYAWYAHEV